MLKENVERALNDQIDAEVGSAWLYFSMAAWFQWKNLPGMANWMRVQGQEELTHAQKFYDFVLARGGRVRLGTIEAPQGEWESPLAAFEAALKHEQWITSRIDDLTVLATEGRDHATRIFLEWFVTEQVEEEASAEEVVQKLRLLGDSGPGLFLLDREMATRTFTPPGPAEGA